MRFRSERSFDVDPGVVGFGVCIGGRHTVGLCRGAYAYAHADQDPQVDDDQYTDSAYGHVDSTSYSAAYTNPHSHAAAHCRRDAHFHVISDSDRQR